MNINKINKSYHRMHLVYYNVIESLPIGMINL